MDAAFPNVVLIGARASGKSRASRKLAARVGWTRVSTDELLEARFGPIAAFVERFGWERFRKEESAVLQGVTGERLVVDCGGGIVETPQNIPRLRELGTVYWARAPVAYLKQRLARPKHRAGRPALPGIPPEDEAVMVPRAAHSALPGSRRCRSVELRVQVAPTRRKRSKPC